MDNAKSKKLSIILSILWFFGGLISSFGIYGTSNSIFMTIILLVLVIYWGIFLKFGSDCFQTFFETSKIYAPIMDITNLVLQIKNLRKEKGNSLTILKYRGLYIFAVAILIISYFSSSNLELAEKIGTILIYSPFIFLALNGKKPAYLVFFVLISLDCFSGLMSGGMIIHNIMKWLLLSIVTINAYTVENMK